MINLELKPSPKTIQQIGAIERFSGYWERACICSSRANEETSRNTQIINSIFALKLDSSTSPVTNLEIARVDSDTINCDYFNANHKVAELIDLINAHENHMDLEVCSIKKLYLNVSKSIKPSFGNTNVYRINSLNFTSSISGKEEVVFPSVSAFLVESRLNELLEWTKQELSEGLYHPLYIIGVFHLLFLQIQPFSIANHRLSLLLLWQLLDKHNYSFVRSASFIQVLEKNSKQYFNSLRQAEKTAGNTWTTINIWLEFFLDSLVTISEQLLSTVERELDYSKLTSIQQKIIEVVKSSGAATRERIASETGINVSTVKYNLSVLSDKGHLKRDGNGRTTNYSVI